MKKVLKGVLVAIQIIFIFICCYGYKIWTSNHNKNQYQEVIYIVQPGDTLWNIGKMYVKTYEENKKWVEEVQEINDFNDTKIFLRPGDEITIIARTEKAGDN